MDDTCFDLLCQGMSAEEAKLFRKMLAEWCDGDEDSFPVHLALLTCAQWRAAAQMPLTLEKNSKALWAQLAEYHKQITALMVTLGSAGDEKIKAFEDTVATHTEAMERVAKKSGNQLTEIERFAREIRGQMESGLRESARITKAFVDESQQLEAARLRYERNLEWRELFMRFMSYVIAIGSGILTGYCMQH
jgi:hypothetical protein